MNEQEKVIEGMISIAQGISEFYEVVLKKIGNSHIALELSKQMLLGIITRPMLTNKNEIDKLFQTLFNNNGKYKPQG